MPEKTTDSTNKIEADMTVGLELPRLLERMVRRYLDVLGPLLEKAGASDISPAQFMMLQHLASSTGPAEISVRELMERGHYVGSNASYNLKQLVECGYAERSAALRDKRAARVKLTAKGQNLLQVMRDNDRFMLTALYDVMGGPEAVEVSYKTLRQLENRWRDALHAETADILHFIE